MTPEAFTDKKRLLSAFIALKSNVAFVTELWPIFEKHYEGAIAGLRSREHPERRAEFIEAADNAERLIKFVDDRIRDLETQTKDDPED